MNSYIIAEVGVNHNGSVEMAADAVIAAKKAGADCVKFQTFKAERIVSSNSPKAHYQLQVTDSFESQFDMLKKLELTKSDYQTLMKLCKDESIDFLSTPYNKEDVDFLESLGVSMYKVASGQLTEIHLLEYIAATGKKIFLSTGMGTMADVFNAVESIRNCGNNNICVLQCTTNYPSKVEDANILAMLSIKEACKVEVGYSDHVAENFASYAAVALGAKVIEKHFTLDKNLPGPDHSSSLGPNEFESFVYGIRQIELSLGNGIKRPSEEEIKNSYGMKRSLVLLKDINKGQIITEDIIGFKRPANGLSPNYFKLIVGKKVNSDMKKDDPFLMNSIIW